MAPHHPNPPVDTDRNLLFGVLALQADLIDNQQFIDGCGAWAARKDVALADLLMERGWLTPEAKTHVEFLLQAKLKKHRGDVHATLAAATVPQVRHSLAGLPDADIQQICAALSPADPSSTTDYHPEARGRYQLLRLHATGGLGQVWLARDGDLGREIALKELKPERCSEPATRVRFLEEAQITGQLEHPSIVPVYELVHRESPSPFYTMRFIRGRTLREASAAYHEKRRAGQTGPLELRQLLGAFVSACNAVAYAHARGVIHRDLKGQNIALGDFGEVMVLDWGLAKVLGVGAVRQPPPKGTNDGGAKEELPPLEAREFGTLESPREATLAGQALGTPSYMAPEQAEGRVDLIDARSDIYGLGAILFEILTDKPPHAGRDKEEALRHVIHGDTPRAKAFEPSVPPALDAICAKAMAKERQERYDTATALAEDIQRFLADEPVSAWPDPWKVRLRRWVTRHRTSVTAAAAALLVALVSLGLATARLTAANRDLTEANEREQKAAADAQASYHLAREAVDNYLAKVSDNPRLKAVGLRGLRKDLLEEAGKFYQRLLQEGAEDPTLAADRGTAHYKLGQIAFAVGNVQESISHFQQAVVIFSQLATAHPDNPRYSLELNRTRIDLGWSYYTTGEMDRAEQEYQKAIPTLKTLADAHPEVLDYAKSLANAHMNLVTVVGERGRAEESINAALETIKLLRVLSGRFPAARDIQRLLAGQLSNLGNGYLFRGKPAEGEKYYLEAVDILERLTEAAPDDLGALEITARTRSNLAYVYLDKNNAAEFERQTFLALAVKKKLAEAHPDVPDYQAMLARGHLSAARVYRKQGKDVEARQSVDRSIALFRSLADAYPKNPFYGYGLTECQMGLGEFLEEAGKTADAGQAFLTALETYKETVRSVQAIPEMYQHLGVACTIHVASAGNHAVSTREVEALIKGTPRNAENIYNAALVYSVSSASARRDAGLTPADQDRLAEKYAVRSMELLQQAKAAGYFQKSSGLEHLKNDPELSGLRSRPDFRKLLTDLVKEEPAQPGKDE
jgi:serine/threonine-protein kinase